VVMIEPFFWESRLIALGRGQLLVSDDEDLPIEHARRLGWRNGVVREDLRCAGPPA